MRTHACALLGVAVALGAGSVGRGETSIYAKPAFETRVTNGRCLAPSPSYCLTSRVSVSGTLRIQHFAVEARSVVARGVVVDGMVSAYPARHFGATFFAGVPLTLRVAHVRASCSTATLTLRGSNVPSPPASYEPLPPVLFFDLVYAPSASPLLTQSVAVGLLPAKLTLPGHRGDLCSLAAVVARGSPPTALAAALNALV